MSVGGRVAGVVCERASPNIKAEKIRLRVAEEEKIQTQIDMF
jgi:hypothetical protein